MLKQAFTAILCLLCHAATAGTIYKCVDAGTVSYHDRPCGAAAVALAVPVAAPAPEVVERLARQRALLQEIEDERARCDQQAAREQQRAERAALVQRRHCDKLRLQRKWLDEDSARAGKDEAERARLKARRQAEVLAMECPA
ncbi:DUF4124 domain-containing protein [Massilia yuzhufengensis]|uniref:DUF4124 domain-containing protein n=1 Tax=Massilia yuzhufengensis TaxID=1164594 RepID=A0A1I1M0I8_9BURK|nr:DUF4124 domain-containing protein [Massilia yuzhufengensis]SFC78881.1 protein of unknown function [Massilia yuzhufengensis]